MAIISKKDSRKQILESPDAFFCHKSEQAELIELSLKQGEEIEMHLNLVNVIFYVLSGVGVLIIDNQSYTLQSGDIAQIYPDEQRAWINNFENELRLLAIKI